MRRRTSNVRGRRLSLRLRLAARSPRRQSISLTLFSAVVASAARQNSLCQIQFRPPLSRSDGRSFSHPVGGSSVLLESGAADWWRSLRSGGLQVRFCSSSGRKLIAVVLSSNSRRLNSGRASASASAHLNQPPREARLSALGPTRLDERKLNPLRGVNLNQSAGGWRRLPEAAAKETQRPTG